MKLNKLTKLTTNFYDQYPFPRLSKQKVLSLSKNINNLLLKMGFPKKLLSQPLNVLDAGCGTGSFSLSFGYANPNCKIIAFNISKSSIS